jgi:hypothetical protein
VKAIKITPTVEKQFAHTNLPRNGIKIMLDIQPDSHLSLILVKDEPTRSGKWTYVEGFYCLLKIFLDRGDIALITVLLQEQQKSAPARKLFCLLNNIRQRSAEKVIKVRYSKQSASDLLLKFINRKGPP